MTSLYQLSSHLLTIKRKKWQRHQSQIVRTPQSKVALLWLFPIVVFCTAAHCPLKNATFAIGCWHFSALISWLFDLKLILTLKISKWKSEVQETNKVFLILHKPARPFSKYTITTTSTDGFPFLPMCVHEALLGNLIGLMVLQKD